MDGMLVRSVLADRPAALVRFHAGSAWDFNAVTTKAQATAQTAATAVPTAIARGAQLSLVRTPGWAHMHGLRPADRLHALSAGHCEECSSICFW